jgi:hypothetical protein
MVSFDFGWRNGRIPVAFWGDAMKRFRLSTLMLLIVIAALCLALVVQHNRAAQREAKLRAALEINILSDYYTSLYGGKNGSVVPVRSYSGQTNKSRGKG